VKAHLVSLGFTIGSVISGGSEAWLQDVRIIPIGGDKPEPDKFVATLVYRSNPRQEVKIESNISLSQINTNIDKDGAAIEVSYDYPSDWAANADYAGKTITQGGKVDKFIPETVVTFRIREAIDPATEADTYVGTTNSLAWRSKVAGEWMCTSITGFSDNSGAYFENAYSFQHREGGWNPRVVFNDSNTGKPPPDVESSSQPDAVALPELYEQTNFNTLFLFP
jgi:hypothetical protein